jgi:hypothetical protein
MHVTNDSTQKLFIYVVQIHDRQHTALRCAALHTHEHSHAYQHMGSGSTATSLALPRTRKPTTSPTASSAPPGTSTPLRSSPARCSLRQAKPPVSDVIMQSPARTHARTHAHTHRCLDTADAGRPWETSAREESRERRREGGREGGILPTVFLTRSLPFYSLSRLVYVLQCPRAAPNALIRAAFPPCLPPAAARRHEPARARVAGARARVASPPSFKRSIAADDTEMGLSVAPRLSREREGAVGGSATATNGRAQLGWGGGD